MSFAEKIYQSFGRLPGWPSVYGEGIDLFVPEFGQDPFCCHPQLQNSAGAVITPSVYGYLSPKTRSFLHQKKNVPGIYCLSLNIGEDDQKINPFDEFEKQDNYRLLSFCPTYIPGMSDGDVKGFICSRVTDKEFNLLARRLYKYRLEVDGFNGSTRELTKKLEFDGNYASVFWRVLVSRFNRCLLSQFGLEVEIEGEDCLSIEYLDIHGNPDTEGDFL